MTITILRLLEDYVSTSPDPSIKKPIKLYKRNLIMQVAAPKDGWVLVRAFDDKKRPPVWIPESLVKEAQVGFYRALKEIYMYKRDNISSGEIIQVLSIKCLGDGHLPGLFRCELKPIGDSTIDMFCWPCELEPLDVAVGPPGFLPGPIETSEQPEFGPPQKQPRASQKHSWFHQIHSTTHRWCTRQLSSTLRLR